MGSHDKSHKSVDLFSFSNEVTGGSHVESNGFDFSQISVVENGIASDPFSHTKWKETKDDSDPQPPNVGADDESFGKFETAFQESGTKPQVDQSLFFFCFLALYFYLIRLILNIVIYHSLIVLGI